METLSNLYPVVLLLAAGYLLVTRRRSRRAAVLGVAGVALLGVWPALFYLGSNYDHALTAVGWTDAATRRVGTIWLPRIAQGWAYGLLIWAVLVDRRPVVPEGDDGAA